MSGLSPSAVRKKLIEVSIPLEAINAASAKEKSIRHGHPSTIHLWWARRPLAACRAVLFAQLVDDPSSWPCRFPTPEAQESERKRLHELIARMVPWEASNNETILNEARWEIARSVAWGLGEEPPSSNDAKAVLAYLQDKAPPVYDPFSGGASIPLEAQRLGLRALGSDLNPVAVLIGKALVEIPPRFSSRPPVNPDARQDRRLVGKRWQGSQGLAEDVRWYGRWIRDEAEHRIGNLYPKTRMQDGTTATVVAWLWARTVRSPDPAARGAMVPLVSNWLLSTKRENKVWVEAVIDNTAKDGYRFDIRSGPLSKEEEDKLKKGTIGRSGGGSCILTGASMPFTYIRSQGQTSGLGERLLAIVVETPTGRSYLPPTSSEEDIARSAAPAWEPLGDLPNNPRDFKTPNYGLRTFASLFTPRQLVALTTFSDLVEKAKEAVFQAAKEAGLEEGTPLREGGNGALAYAEAVATYLAFAVSKSSTRSCTLAIWEPGMGRLAGAIGRQALPIQWSFAETNPLAGAGGDIAGTAYSVAENLDRLGLYGAGFIHNRAAQKNSYADTPIVVSTDPPYYDNIAYADLSDFFYIWLQKPLRSVWPDLFRRLVTPKDDELVATPYRHGSKARAEEFFIEGMRAALTAIQRASAENVPVTIFYAFKQSEAGEEGVTSAGWGSFLEAVLGAGFVVDGTWPVRSEATNALKANMNALASSVVLVCRKRGPDAAVSNRADFLRELRKELPGAMKEIVAARIGPVDLEQALIGPGMNVFSRYSSVQESDDSSMSVKTALSLINRVRLEIDGEAGNYDPETHVAIAWFRAYGFSEKISGEAITLATPKGVSLDALLKSGVFTGRQGKVRLMKRDELPSSWSPKTDRHATVWECVQHAARALEQGGSTGAAVLIKAMGRKAEDALSLAYRLYDIANAKGEAMEARVYAELAAEWPELETLAASLPEDAVEHKPAPAQASLFG